MLSESILLFFRTLGPIGLIMSFSIIVYLDGLSIPTLPEAWLVFIVASNATPHWIMFGLALIFVGIVCTVGAQYTLFSILKKTGMPKFIKKIMKKYTDILIVSSEKLVFFNWLVPVLPVTGAFIAAKKEWNPKLAFAYSFLGGAIKMPLLVCIAFAFPLVMSSSEFGNAILAFVLIVVLASLCITFFGKRKMKEKIL